MNVTTTSLRQGKFETRFWHKVLEEEVGRVKGHFGPINTYGVFKLFIAASYGLLIRLLGFPECSIAVHPAGTSYASGGEDGFVRVHHFDESYFRAKPYGDLHIED
jgi:translation initiation factor 3 subunit I